MGDLFPLKNLFSQPLEKKFQSGLEKGVEFRHGKNEEGTDGAC